MTKIMKRLTMVMLAFLIVFTGSGALTVNAASTTNTLKVKNTSGKEIKTIDVVVGKTAKIKLTSYANGTVKSTKKYATPKSKKVATTKVSGNTVTITGVKIGTTTLTLKDKKGTKTTIAVRTVPAKEKITSATRKKNGNVVLKWTQDSLVTGYEIYRSYDGENYKKIKTISKNSTVTYTDKISDVYASYKIRSYKKVGGKYIYGAFSKVKTMKDSNGIKNFELYITGMAGYQDGTFTYKYESTGTSVIYPNVSVGVDGVETGGDEGEMVTYTIADSTIVAFLDNSIGGTVDYFKYLSSSKVKSKNPTRLVTSTSIVEKGLIAGKTTITATLTKKRKTYKDSITVYVLPYFFDAYFPSDNANQLGIYNTYKNATYELYMENLNGDYQLYTTFAGNGTGQFINCTNAASHNFKYRAYIIGPNGEKWYTGWTTIINGTVKRFS